MTAPITIPAGELTAKHIGRRIEISAASSYIQRIDHDRYETVIRHSRSMISMRHNTPVTILPEEADNG